IFGRRAVVLGYRLRGEQAALASAIHEHLAAQPVVKAFGLRARARRALEGQADGVAALARRFAFFGAMTERSPNIGMLIFGTLIVAGGGFMAFDGALSIGSLVSFNVLFVTVSAYVESLTAVASTLLQAAGGMQRIREILDEQPAVTEPPGARTL